MGNESRHKKMGQENVGEYKMKKTRICVTSQKGEFPCCVCQETVKPHDLFLSLGCHIDCAGLLIWNNIDKEKPNLGDTVLVFDQGYGENNNYYYRYKIATYIRQPNDKRKKVFADALQVKIEERFPWIYKNVTHWMALTKPPKKTLKEAKK